MDGRYWFSINTQSLVICICVCVFFRRALIVQLMVTAVIMGNEGSRVAAGADLAMDDHSRIHLVVVFSHVWMQSCAHRQIPPSHER